MPHKRQSVKPVGETELQLLSPIGTTNW